MSGFRTHHARSGLTGAAVLVALVAVPLGFATSKLIEQSQLEVTLRTALLHNTQTFKRAELVDFSVDWLATPVRVDLLVRAAATVTAHQVGDLQSFAERKIGRPLQLVVSVSRITSVEAASTPVPPKPTGRAP